MIELTPEVILINKAKRFATERHAGQMYGNEKYTYHLEQVVANVATRMKGDPLLSTYIAAAWLHDVMEDCGVKYDEIKELFGSTVANAVYRLTRTDDLSYNEYLVQCIEFHVSREVKICDTMANLTESFKSGNAKGLAKYPKQLDMLLKGEVE